MPSRVITLRTQFGWEEITAKDLREFLSQVPDDTPVQVYRGSPLKEVEYSEIEGDVIIS